MSTTAVYIRVSTTGQNSAGQRLEINRWLKGNGIDDVQWFVDKETGDHLERKAFHPKLHSPACQEPEFSIGDLRGDRALRQCTKLGRDLQRYSALLRPRKRVLAQAK